MASDYNPRSIFYDPLFDRLGGCLLPKSLMALMSSFGRHVCVHSALVLFHNLRFPRHQWGRWTGRVGKRLQRVQAFDHLKLAAEESGGEQHLEQNQKLPSGFQKQFYKRNLSPIEHAGGNLTDMECRRWSNQQDELCYDCNSCKAAVLANLKHDWCNFSGCVLFCGVLVLSLVPYE
ncbi:hypothetical protein SUGI_0241610 [Cryptomeria japonica]|nr:hypothetical protein SUGI_0241610 [Cryptomeria japonica]